MSVRYQVDVYDEQHSLNDTSTTLDANTLASAAPSPSHVRLGSLNNILHLGSYAKKLSIDIHLDNFQELLSRFFFLNRVFGARDEMMAPDSKVCIAHAYVSRALILHAGGSLSSPTGHV